MITETEQVEITAPEAVVETAVETPAAETTPQPSAEEQALAAMDKGIEAVTPEAPAPAQEAVETPPVEAAKPAETAKVEPAKPEPDAAVEAEIKALNLKAKGAERFRAMANEIKAAAPIRDALEKAGIKDAAAFVQQVPVLVQRAKDFEDLVGMVSETGATPDMYSAMLDYMAESVRAVNGDLAAAQRAYDRTTKEQAVWAKLLGKEVPGVHDPLAEHADLKAEVEAGDLPRPRALELVQQRNAAKLNDGYRARNEQHTAHEQAVTQGKESLNALGAQLAAADPDYARKQPFLLPSLRVITQTLPPNQWVQAAQNAYSQIPALPPVAAPKPAPGPMRSSGPRPSLRQTTDDPMKALEMGIAAADA